MTTNTSKINPNSLANLKRGKDNPFCNRNNARDAARRSHEARRRNKTMREIAEHECADLRTIVLPDGTQMMMSKLEIIIRNFLNECASNPTHKNILALRKLLGEDEMAVSINIEQGSKYDDIVVTREMMARAETIMQIHSNNSTE